MLLGADSFGFFEKSELGSFVCKKDSRHRHTNGICILKKTIRLFPARAVTTTASSLSELGSVKYVSSVETPADFGRLYIKINTKAARKNF